MPGNEWVYTALAVVLATHLVTLAYAVFAHRRGADGDGDADDGAGTAAVCRCPECGTANDAGYRYCKHCVAELPGVASTGAPGGHSGHPY